MGTVIHAKHWAIWEVYSGRLNYVDQFFETDFNAYRYCNVMSIVALRYTPTNPVVEAKTTDFRRRCDSKPTPKRYIDDLIAKYSDTAM
jgi:hypothetical protein